MTIAILLLRMCFIYYNRKTVETINPFVKLGGYSTIFESNEHYSFVDSISYPILSTIHANNLTHSMLENCIEYRFDRLMCR